MHQHPHHVLRAQLVLGGKFPVVSRSIDEQYLISMFGRALFTQDQKAAGDARPIENIQRQGNHGVDQPGVEQGLPDQMFVVSLAALQLWITVVIELARLLLELGLAPKKHALRANNPSATIVGERRDNVQNKRIVPVAGGRCLKSRTAAEAAERVFVPFLAKDLLFELVVLFFVVRLLLRLEPPELVREGKIGENERELLDVPIFEKLWVRDRACARLDVGF
jgi:hypothetical protein